MDRLHCRRAAGRGVRRSIYRRRLTDDDNRGASALIDFVNQVRAQLLVAEIMVGLDKVALPKFDVAAIKDFTRHALDAITEGKIGYAILTAAKA